MKIALAMILKASDDELVHFTRCIESVKDYVDGIFINLNSTKKIPDTMVQKVKEITDGVVEINKWESDFAKARNQSFDMVPKDYDWIIWLDSDDTVENAHKLRSLLGKAPTTADGIMVNYKYDSDEFGNVTTAHINLRVVRNNSAFGWKGKLHETLIEKRRVSRVMTKDFDVLHHADDERKDASNVRNIHIMEQMLKDDGQFPDPRTLYYLGTAYIDAGRYDESIELLQTYLKLSGWDEERGQAHVWLGRTYRDYCLNNKIAAEHFLQALYENPKEVGAYIELAQMEMSDKRWSKAIHWLEMAVVKKEEASSLVKNPMENTYRAFMMLAECHMEIGGNNIDIAQKLVERAYKIRPDKFTTDYLMMIKHIIKEKTTVTSFVNAVKRMPIENVHKAYAKLDDEYKSNPAVIGIMRKFNEPKVWEKNSIAIYCGNSALKGWGPWSLAEGTGGSEEAVIRISKRLQALGWKVTVYAEPGAKDGEYDGVKWLNYWELDLRDTYDIFVGWRCPWFFETKVNARKTYLWLHDVMDDEEFTPERLKNINKIMLLSKYHKTVYPSIPDDKVFYTGNGIDPEDFEKWDNQIERDNHRVVYMSSHVRGLDNLYKIWPDVIKEVPDASLDVYYGWNSYDEINRNNPERMAWKDEMIALEKSLPNVKDHGRIGQEDIVKAIQGAGVWAYPTQFCEIYCITAVKAQAGGAWPVCTDFAALEEMVEFGYRMNIGSMKEDKTVGLITDKELETYKQELIKALKNPVDDATRKEMMEHVRKGRSWQATADGWDKEFKS